MSPLQSSSAIATGCTMLTAELTAGASDVLRRPETRKGLNSGLALWERRDQTRRTRRRFPPKPQVAGSIPVPPAHFSLISWGLQRLRLSPLTAVVTAVRAAEPSWPGLSSAAREPNTYEIGKRRPTGRPLWGRFQAASNALMNTADRTASVSKTAGRRCACCPTCPRILNSWILLPRGPSAMCVL